ncbi:MAG: thiamine pyrophosphate-binding protein [Acidimicrobiia bacterium]|nr:thiamine pyrophosphate-binding protein [Acidimicrobiia bacterium]
MVISGGHLLIQCLIEQGAATAFGVPGESYLAALDGMNEAGDAFRFVTTRNEAGASFMAEAWGKLTGRPGICFVTRGPGATNASIGVHTAAQNSTPMILFIGQVPTHHRGKEAFQEMDYNMFFGSVAKRTVEVLSASDLPEVVASAFAIAMSERPGPVVVSLPEDVLADETDATPLGRVDVAERTPAVEDVNWAVELLRMAERPLVLVGGGLWTDQGREDLQAMAETNALAVSPVFRFHDLMDNHSPSYVGEAGVGMPVVVKETILTADVVLAIGIRFGEMTTAGYTLFTDPDQTLIHAHASEAEFGKIVQPTLAIHAGPNETVSALRRANIGATPQRRRWVEARRAAFETSIEFPHQPGDLDMSVVMKWLRENLPDDVIITNGAGNFSIWNNKSFLYGPGMRLLGPQNGAMGYGLPAAIAAKVLFPNRMAVAFVGDGDFQMNCQELGAAFQAHATPIVLVINNGSYGTIRMHQERTYPHRVAGTELINPDFAALARAYGFYGETVTDTGAFPQAFARASESSTGAVLDLIVSPDMLTPTQSIDQARRAHT